MRYESRKGDKKFSWCKYTVYGEFKMKKEVLPNDPAKPLTNAHILSLVDRIAKLQAKQYACSKKFGRVQHDSASGYLDRSLMLGARLFLSLCSAARGKGDAQTKGVGDYKVILKAFEEAEALAVAAFERAELAR